MGYVKVRACTSCGASIEWVRTVNGRRIPLDVGMHVDGSFALDELGRAYVTEARPARRTHFQTCPDADEHRRRRPRLWNEADR